jgi:hypothetical protein
VLRDGDQVRLSAPSIVSGPLIGEVRLIKQGRLLVEPDGESSDALWIELSQVDRLEVSQGVRSRTGQGAFLGGVLGGVAGMLRLWKDGADCDSGPCLINAGAVAFFVGAGGGGHAGMPIGTVVGSTMRAERWLDVAGDQTVAWQRIFRGDGSERVVPRLTVRLQMRLL